MHGWDEVDKAKEGGGIFIKLKDGESVEGVFRGNPHCFYQKYKDKTEYKDWQDGLSFRFKINLVTKEDGKYVAKIFSSGVTIAKQIRKFIKELGQDTIFKIEREGSTKDDTTYFVIPKGPVQKDSLEKISAVKLRALQPTGSDDSFPEANTESFPEGDAYEPPVNTKDAF